MALVAFVGFLFCEGVLAMSTQRGDEETEKLVNDGGGAPGVNDAKFYGSDGVDAAFRKVDGGAAGDAGPRAPPGRPREA